LDNTDHGSSQHNATSISSTPLNPICISVHSGHDHYISYLPRTDLRSTDYTNNTTQHTTIQHNTQQQRQHSPNVSTPGTLRRSTTAVRALPSSSTTSLSTLPRESRRMLISCTIADAVRRRLPVRDGVCKHEVSQAFKRMSPTVVMAREAQIILL